MKRLLLNNEFTCETAKELHKLKNLYYVQAVVNSQFGKIGLNEALEAFCWLAKRHTLSTTKTISQYIGRDVRTVNAYSYKAQIHKFSRSVFKFKLMQAEESVCKAIREKRLTSQLKQNKRIEISINKQIDRL